MRRVQGGTYLSNAGRMVKSSLSPEYLLGAVELAQHRRLLAHRESDPPLPVRHVVLGEVVERRLELGRQPDVGDVVDVGGGVLPVLRAAGSIPDRDGDEDRDRQRVILQK